MEGSHVIHTDEDGNVLLDNEGDQRLPMKQLEFQEFDEIFQRMQEDPNGIGREQMAEFLKDEFLKDEAVMSERMQEMFGIGASKK